MVAYSFQRQFIERILAGTKRQTIRATGRRKHAKPGDRLQLYSGMRTKHCKLIAEAICESAGPIVLDFNDEQVRTEGPGGLSISTYRMQDLDDFARSDGFTGWDDMRSFWERVHQTSYFQGVIIRWAPVRIEE